MTPTAATTVPPDLVQPLSWVGVPWPAGDEHRLAASARAWLVFARTVRSRRTSADAAAAHAVSRNEGQLVDAHRASWTANRGPAANLARTVAAARLTAAALEAMSTQIATIKRAYTGSLHALVSIARAGSLLAPDGRGGVAIAAGGERLVAGTRVAMLQARDRAVATTASSLKPMLDRTRDSLILARITTPTLHRPPPRHYPHVRDPALGRSGMPEPLRDLMHIADQRIDQATRDRGQRCPDRSSLGLPTIAFVSGTGTDGRTYPTMSTVFDINRHMNLDGSATTTINGVVSDWPRGLKRQNYQSWMDDLREGIALPMKGSSESYDAGHSWGLMLGTEVADGNGWEPTDVNVGIHLAIERELRDLHRSYQADGGYVMVRATMTTFGPGAWPEGPIGDGRHFVRSVDYHAIPCRADGTIGGVRHYGFELTPPRGSVADDTFRAGWPVRVDGVPLRAPNRLGAP